MKQIVFFVFGVLVLTSCVPVIEKSRELDSSVIRSLSTFRDGEEVTLTWGISGALTTYATWIEFYQVGVDGFIMSQEQSVYEEAALLSENTFFYDTFELQRVASYSREGGEETYVLFFRIAVQEPGGAVIRSEPNRITFFTINTVDGEK